MAKFPEPIPKKCPNGHKVYLEEDVPQNLMHSRYQIWKCTNGEWEKKREFPREGTL